VPLSGIDALKSLFQFKEVPIRLGCSVIFAAVVCDQIRVRLGDRSERIADHGSFCAERNASTTPFGNSRPKGFGTPMSGDSRQDKDVDQKDGSHPRADCWGPCFRAGPDRLRDPTGYHRYHPQAPEGLIRPVFKTAIGFAARCTKDPFCNDEAPRAGRCDDLFLRDRETHWLSHRIGHRGNTFQYEGIDKHDPGGGALPMPALSHS